MATHPHELAERIGDVEALDTIAEPLQRAGNGLLADESTRRVLEGEWLGHPLHPLLTDIPIGAFTSAVLLDVIGGRRSRRAAGILVGVGLAASVPTAAAGLADWLHTRGSERRVGVVHVAANSVGMLWFTRSLWARLRGRHVRGAAYALVGMAATSAGGYLGGHLAYSRGVGVSTPADATAPRAVA